MLEKKIYFVAEGIVDGESIQSDKFNQIVNPETRETVFEDVFQITECADFERYKHREEFVSCILDIATEYFENLGEEISAITLTAIDAKTDIFQWGVSISNIEDEEFQYGTIDWKADGNILKLMKNLGDLTFKDFGLDADRNFLEAPICECGCGSRLDIILKSDEDIRDFIVSMISENECNQCAVFVLKEDNTMWFGFSQENDDEIQTYKAQFDFKNKESNYDISELVSTIHAHMYGVLVESEQGLFKVLMQ